MKLYLYDKNCLCFKELSIKYYLGIILAIFMSCIVGFLVSLSISQKKALKPIIQDFSIYGELSLSDLDIKQIALIESGNCDSVCSVDGAIGNMQVTNAGLQEWNNNHKNEQYTLEDLYIRRINLKIGKWLLNKKIPEYLKQHKIPNSLNYRLIIYNSGIGNFLIWYKKGANYNELNKESQSYLLKYWSKY
jgi:hypothetical protein